MRKQLRFILCEQFISLTKDTAGKGETVSEMFTNISSNKVISKKGLVFYTLLFLFNRHAILGEKIGFQYVVTEFFLFSSYINNTSLLLFEFK